MFLGKRIRIINHNSFNGETKYYFFETNYFNLILIFIIGGNHNYF